MKPSLKSFGQNRRRLTVTDFFVTSRSLHLRSPILTGKGCARWGSGGHTAKTCGGDGGKGYRLRTINVSTSYLYFVDTQSTSSAEISIITNTLLNCTSLTLLHKSCTFYVTGVFLIDIKREESCQKLRENVRQRQFFLEKNTFIPGWTLLYRKGKRDHRIIYATFPKLIVVTKMCMIWIQS